MKQKDGNITNDRQEILNVCADFYQELYRSKTNESKPDMISPISHSKRNSEKGGSGH